MVGKAPEENVFWMSKRLSVLKEMSATFGNLSNIQFTFLKRLMIPLARGKGRKPNGIRRVIE